MEHLGNARINQLMEGHQHKGVTCLLQRGKPSDVDAPRKIILAGSTVEAFDGHVFKGLVASFCPRGLEGVLMRNLIERARPCAW